MPKGTNQKFKLYRLAQIMMKKTDEEHYITMPEIKEALAEYDITADRKSLYNDLTLQFLGIILTDHCFQLLDQTVRFLLRDELGRLNGIHQKFKFRQFKRSVDHMIAITIAILFPFHLYAQKLQRQVYVSGRIKAMNESIYYTVDAIHNAISENKKIRFQYFQWNVKKEPQLRHGGAWYHISPWGLSWDDENYYLVGFDSEAGLIKHFRVDKMLRIALSNETREGREHFKKLDMADYARKSFGMFGGEEETVKLQVSNGLAGVIIDRFGKDVMMIPVDEDHFNVSVDVRVSRQFLGWVFSLGESVRILGPEAVVDQMKAETQRLIGQYDIK